MDRGFEWDTEVGDVRLAADDAEVDAATVLLVLAFWIAEWARKAARKFDRKLLCVGIVRNEYLDIELTQRR